MWKTERNFAGYFFVNIFFGKHGLETLVSKAIFSISRPGCRPDPSNLYKKPVFSMV